MSTSACYDLGTRNRRNSPRKAALSPNLLGGTALACLVVGCGWMVYANVFGSEIYPSVNSGDFSMAAGSAGVSNDSPSSFAERFAISSRARLTASNSSVAVEKEPVAAAPVAVSSRSSFSFGDRFAAGDVRAGRIEHGIVVGKRHMA